MRGSGHALHVVLPNDIDDPATPSGGNRYDRRVCQGLAARGWTVHEHAVPGAWPRPTAEQRAGLAGVLAGLPDGAAVLLDGLVAAAVPEVLVPHARRLRLVVLVHQPLAEVAAAFRDGEARALAAAVAVVVTSEWARTRLLDRYPLAPDRVRVAAPGTDPAPPVPGSPGGGNLLCVAALAPHKGHDLLVRALATVPEQPWTAVFVGPLDRDPQFVAGLRRQLDGYGLAGRVRLAGTRTGAELAAAYAAADLLVLASRKETYGMVVTEALARGLPVLASAAGGVPEALGRAPDGTVPGLLVPPGDVPALAVALRDWLRDAGLRARLRDAAHARRTTLAGWPVTTGIVAAVLDQVVAPPYGGPA